MGLGEVNELQGKAMISRNLCFSHPKIDIMEIITIDSTDFQKLEGALKAILDIIRWHLSEMFPRNE